MSQTSPTTIAASERARSVTVADTATLARIEATIEKTRITRSAYSFSFGVTRVSARYRKYTAARIQISAITGRIWRSGIARRGNRANPRTAAAGAPIAKEDRK